MNFLATLLPVLPLADGELSSSTIWLIVAGIVVLLVGVFVLIVFFSFLRLWIQSLLTGAKVGISDMIRMKLVGINYTMVVHQKIALVQAGTKIATQELEAHVLAGGRLRETALAVIAAHKAGMDLPWRIAAAIDLAGRNIRDAVNTYVNPKVIDCPDPTKGKGTLEGICKNGIQLKARARVTVRTKLDRLVGGATEETIIARVGEGIVEAIGGAEHHTDVLANPNMISQAVLRKSLDSQTAFEIVSIDIAEIDVGPGANIGASLQANQAEADLQVARAQAEKRRALAVALEQEMQARVQENRAQVVLSEAEIPKAISQALREGKLGVMDYYHLRNLQSDTQMRAAIAGTADNVVSVADDKTKRQGG
jgi:uncharacterized protein YqfA (UPF0365 family)